MESERQSRFRLHLALVKKRKSKSARTHFALELESIHPVSRRRAALEAILRDSRITKISTRSHIRLAELCSNSVCPIP